MSTCTTLHPCILVFSHAHLFLALCSDQRYFSGILSAMLSAFITFVYLEPLFVPVGLDLAMVALWILSICAGLVGMSLGVLIPTVLPGICFGVSLSLLVGTFLQFYHVLYLPVAGGILSLIGILLSTRYVVSPSCLPVLLVKSIAYLLFFPSKRGQ